MAAVVVAKNASRKTFAGFCLVFLLLSGFYLATFDYRGISDTRLNSLQTRSLVTHGDIDLARYGSGTSRTYVVHRDDHVYSIYGIGVSLVAAPLYLLGSRFDVADSTLEGVAAIAAVAAAGAILFRLLLQLVPARIASVGLVVFAFGTTMWPVAAMALFQHGPVALLQAIGLNGVFSHKRSSPAVAGFGFAAATLIRTPAVILLVVMGLFYLTQGKRSVALYIAGAAMPMGAFLLQNRWLWGVWLTTGYAQIGDKFHGGNVPRGVFALLFGWWRGIFVYSPILLAGVLGWLTALRSPKGFIERRMVFLGGSCLLSVLLYAGYPQWWGGLNQFGYRYLLDIVSPLVVLGAWAMARQPRLRPIAMLLAVLSIMNMSFGMAGNRFGWDFAMFPRAFGDTPLGQAWIVFVHYPTGSILRLLGVAAIAAILAALAPHLATGRQWSRPQATLKRSGRRPEDAHG